MCQVPGHQAVLVLEAVYKHVMVELLATLQSIAKKLYGMIYNHDTNLVILTLF